MKDSLTHSSLGVNNRINDHNVVIDRKYADSLFRGLIEDYYFNGKHNLIL
jgi:hypothetical protein